MDALKHYHVRVLPGHRDRVFALGFSCDGRRLASGSVDMTVKIWQPDRSDYKNSTTLRGHTAKIVALTWDPINPERLATLSEDKTVKIWDIRQGKAVSTIPVPEGPLNIAWSPNGAWIVVGNKTNHMTIIDVKQGIVFGQTKENDEANEMIFSRDSQQLAISSGVGLKLFHFPSMQLLHQIDAHPAACATLDLDPRGRYLALGSNDSIATLWDTSEWFCVRTLTHQDSAVRSVRFSYDGTMLSIATEDKWIDVVSVETGALLHRITTVVGASAVVWSPTKLALAYAVDEPPATGRGPAEGVIRVMST